MTQQPLLPSLHVVSMLVTDHSTNTWNPIGSTRDPADLRDSFLPVSREQSTQYSRAREMDPCMVVQSVFARESKVVYEQYLTTGRLLQNAVHTPKASWVGMNGFASKDS